MRLFIELLLVVYVLTRLFNRIRLIVDGRPMASPKPQVAQPGAIFIEGFVTVLIFWALAYVGAFELLLEFWATR